MAPLATKTPIRINLNPLAVMVIVALLLALGWSWFRSTHPAQVPQAVLSTNTEPEPLQTAADTATQAGHPFGAPLSAKEESAQQQSVFSTLEARFREDTPDAGWAVPAEKKLIEAASAPSLARFGVPLSYNASCNGHICKIMLSFADRTQADAWSKLYVDGLADIAGSARFAVSPSADGKADLVIYATRPGSEALLLDPLGGGSNQPLRSAGDR